MKVLVTGVAGFIGSNLADRLVKEGHSVVGIDDLSAGILEQVPKEVKLFKVDIRSKDIRPIFNGVDVVFHLAARNCVPDCQLHPYETADVNIMGTINVFEAAKAAKVNRVIYAESAAIYEGSTKVPTPETEFAPQTYYAISKAANHLFAKAYGEFEGMKMVGLRYLNVYGPRQDYRRAVPPVMSRFIIKLLRNEHPPVYGDGTDRRDYIHIDDLNNFHMLCLTSGGVVNKVFNLGSGKSYSILEVLAMIQQMLGTNIKPEFVANVPGAARESRADISEARKVGWEPKVPINEGLQGMMTCIKSEMAKGNIPDSI